MRTAIFQTFINPTRKAIIVIITIKAMTPFADNLSNKMQEVSKQMGYDFKYENVMKNIKSKAVF